MYGPAGSGKTTIAQSVAEVLAEYHCLAASFFWSRSGEGRPTINKQFVATIAHQMYLSIPGFPEAFSSALHDDPGVFDRTLSKQLQQLVLQPLNYIFHSNPSLFSSSSIFFLLLVDGLDECVGDSSQREVLNVLSEFLAGVLFPVRVLLSSRDEQTIRSAVTLGPLKSQATLLALATEYHALNDIKILFETRFLEVKTTHSERHISAEWPSRQDVEELVRRSAGLFVYADVAMKYIESPYNHPAESLQEILSVPDTNNLPFSELDAMYALILHKVPPQNISCVRDILSAITVSKEKPSLSLCDELFDFRYNGKTDIFLRGHLASVVNVPPNQTDSLGFFHASFGDLLTDSTRLQQQNAHIFFCDIPQAHAKTAIHWINLYTRRVDDTVVKVPDKSLSSYAKMRDMVRTTLVEPLFNISRHCNSAQWGADLTNSLRNLDLTKCLPSGQPSDPDIRWNEIALLLDFLLWMLTLPAVSNFH